MSVLTAFCGTLLFIGLKAIGKQEQGSKLAEKV
jgi:hypothetical protein